MMRSQNERKADNLDLYQHSYKDFFENKKYKVNLIIMIYLWVFSFFSFFDLQVNQDLLPGSVYINFGILTVADICGALFFTYLKKKYDLNNIYLQLSFLNFVSSLILAISI